MATKRPALGRGLSALIPNTPPPARESQPTDRPRTLELDIDLLVPNPRQPRGLIADDKLDELAQSIRANGVIQPIVVRRNGEQYEIVAGERRWRASQRAGLLKVPVAIKDVADEKLLEVALIENIQREDLTPIEEAQAYRRLTDEFGLSQDAVAAQVGKDRATVANYMRLLRLPAEVRNALSEGALTMGHARALLSLTSDSAQRAAGREVIAKGLSVRDTEALVRRQNKGDEPKPEPPRPDANTRAAEDQLKLALGTRVRIIRKGKAGRIQIEFTSEDELQRLFEAITER
jgi:ParB family transcriptional regulator, chromosome partitioning protein